MDALGFGFRVGHWTNAGGGTGCTVILPPPENVASCDIRGSSPSSRETEHLHLDRRLTEIHGLLLTGGSAFGLAAAEGVVRWLEEAGIGYQTPLGPVPIVPAAVVFDLGTKSNKERPDATAGRLACEGAVERDVDTGAVGAGTGATVGKWSGLQWASPGGVGIARAEEAGSVVAAIAVVNSVGDVLNEDGSVLAGTRAPSPEFMPPLPEERAPAVGEGLPTNTVLAAVVTEGRLEKRDVRWLASRGSDGISVAVRPAHTRYDGDVVFAICAPGPPANVDLLGYLATKAVADAVRNAVRRD